MTTLSHILYAHFPIPFYILLLLFPVSFHAYLYLCYREGFTDNYASTGTLNRILQENTQDNDVNYSDDDDFEEEQEEIKSDINGDIKMKNDMND